MSKPRTIRFAIDKDTEEQVDADILFKDTKAANAIRTKYNEDKLTFACVECDQALTVSKSGKGKVHFKHELNSDYCILKENLNEKEFEEFHRAIKNKESLRHKELKRKIENGLKLIADTADISQEARIKKEGILKKPDVYCRYKDYEIAFEIQLSDLSYRYILDRHNFYKKHNIYLIWILDDFNVQAQDRLEKDIKYLSEHQNYFHLDEAVDALKLVCEYKLPFIRDDEVQSKWREESISLNQLHFDKEHYQVYFYNFKLETQRREKELESLRQIEEARRIEAQGRRKTTEIVSALKELYRKDTVTFPFIDSLEGKLSVLNPNEKIQLNDVLKFKEKRVNGKPFFNSLIASGQHDNLLRIILSADAIDKDVNSADDSGVTPLQELLNSESMQKDMFIDLLFKCGYRKNEADLRFIEKKLSGENAEEAKKAFYLKCSFDLANFEMIQRIKKTNLQSVLRTIYSFKMGYLVGFRFGRENFTSLFNNAFEQHKQYGDIVMKAVRVYGRYDMLKQSCRDKITAFSLNKPEQDKSCEDIFRKIYAELYCM